MSGAAAAPTAGGGAPAATPAAAGTAPAAGTEAPKTGAAPVAPKAETPAQKAARMKIRAKFDGKEEELELDEAEAARYVQKTRHYEKTRGDFDKQVKAFEERLAALEKDPVGFLAQRGVDLKQLSAQEQARAKELEALSPEARRIRELEEKLAMTEREKAERAENDKRTAAQQEHQALVKKTASTLDAALKLSGLPRSGELLKTYVEVQELAEHAGEPELSPEQVVAAGDRLMMQRLGDMLKAAQNDGWRQRNEQALTQLALTAFAPLIGKLPALSGEALVKMLGAPNVKAIAKAAFDLYRGGKAPIVQEPVTTPAPPAAAPNGARVTEWDVIDKFQAA